MRNLLFGLIIGAGVATGVFLALPDGPSSEKAQASWEAMTSRRRALESLLEITPPDAEEARQRFQGLGSMFSNQERFYPQGGTVDGLIYADFGGHKCFILPPEKRGASDQVVSVLELGSRHAEILKEVGLYPFSSRWWCYDRSNKEEGDIWQMHSQYEAKDLGTVSRGSNQDSRGNWSSPVFSNARTIVNWRGYKSYECGAVLFVRSELRPEHRRLNVEFYYTDRTHSTATYPGGTIQFEEGMTQVR